MIDWTPLADLIETHDRFLVTTHVRPDGDALGSEVGMAGLLRQKGKDVRVVNASPTPPRYDFLDPDGSLFEHFGTTVRTSDLADREVAVILDLSAWNQLGEMADFIRGFAGPRVVIDHHVSQDDLGATFLKDTTAEATGTLVMSAITALGGTLTREVATGLLTAIAMDTGWFRHTNTRPRTLRAVADLIDSGAEIAAIYRDLFERNTLGRLRLMGATLSGLQTEQGGRIAYATISRDDLERTGAIPRTRRTWSISRSACGGSTWACSSSSRPGAGSRSRSDRGTGLIAPGWPRRWEEGATARRPAPPWPGRWPRRWTACSAPCARPLIPPPVSAQG